MMLDTLCDPNLVRTLVSLLIGGALLAAGGTALAAWTTSARDQRALWRMAMAAMIALLGFELAGLGPGLVSGLRERRQPSAVGISVPSKRFPIEAAFSDLQGSGRAAPQLTAPSDERLPSVGALKGPADWRSGIIWQVPLGKRDPPCGKTEAPAERPWVAEAGLDRSGAAVVLAVWGLVAAVFVAQALFRRVGLCLFVWRRCQAMSEEVAGALLQMASAAGYRRRLRLLQAAQLRAPVAFGCLRPTIVIPGGFARRYTRIEQQAILIHELAHLEARDPWWNGLSYAVCAAIWWHPAAWFIRRRLLLACEMAADERVMCVPCGPSTLARCLVELGRRFPAARPLGWLGAAGTGFRSNLGRRVTHLLALPECIPSPQRRAAGRRASSTCVLLTIFVVSLSSVWAIASGAPQKGDEKMQWFHRCWRHSLVASVLFAAALPALGQNADEPIWVKLGIVQEVQDGSDEQAGEQPEAAGRGRREAPPQGSPRRMERLERRIAELEAQLAEAHAERDHAWAAAEDARAAAVHDQAQMLLERGHGEEAHRLLGEFMELLHREPGGRGRGGLFAPGPGTGPPPGRVQPPMEDLREAVDDLRRQFRRLAQLMDEIHQRMDRLTQEMDRRASREEDNRAR
jgi:beta-lactamase regulating signal transducer with metallopeptidase domain